MIGINNANILLAIAIILAVISSVGCFRQSDDPAQIANPSAIYCVEQGNQYMIKTEADGSQSGICVFPDGTSCEGWAYFRNKCGANETSDSTPDDMKPATCTADSDCVPRGCCHPTACAHKNSMKPSCEGIMCTMECRPGTLDCGYGSCRCIEGECEAIIG